MPRYGFQVRKFLFRGNAGNEGQGGEEIWQALVQHIEWHGLTQAHLVTMLKVHQSDVSNLLHGENLAHQHHQTDSGLRVGSIWMLALL